MSIENSSEFKNKRDETPKSEVSDQIPNKTETKPKQLSKVFNKALQVFNISSQKEEKKENKLTEVDNQKSKGDSSNTPTKKEGDDKPTSIESLVSQTMEEPEDKKAKAIQEFNKSSQNESTKREKEGGEGEGNELTQGENREPSKEGNSSDKPTEEKEPPTSSIQKITDEIFEEEDENKNQQTTETQDPNNSSQKEDNDTTKGESQESSGIVNWVKNHKAVTVAAVATIIGGAAFCNYKDDKQNEKIMNALEQSNQNNKIIIEKIPTEQPKITIEKQEALYESTATNCKETIQQSVITVIKRENGGLQFCLDGKPTDAKSALDQVSGVPVEEIYGKTINNNPK